MQPNSRISTSLTRDTCTKLGMVTSVEEIGLVWSAENSNYVRSVLGILGIATYIGHNPNPSPFSISISILISQKRSYPQT